jgi:hypothetical protein
MSSLASSTGPVTGLLASTGGRGDARAAHGLSRAHRRFRCRPQRSPTRCSARAFFATSRVHREIVAAWKAGNQARGRRSSRPFETPATDRFGPRRQTARTDALGDPLLSQARLAAGRSPPSARALAHAQPRRTMRLAIFERQLVHRQVDPAQWRPTTNKFLGPSCAVRSARTFLVPISAWPETRSDGIGRKPWGGALHALPADHQTPRTRRSAATSGRALPSSARSGREIRSDDDGVAAAAGGQRTRRRRWVGRDQALGRRVAVGDRRRRRRWH